MENNSVRSSIVIHTEVSKVWNTLTDPGKIALYLGAQTHTDWAAGSPITWEGEMHGARFQNKGQVLENKKYKLLRFTYWSGMGGDADLPENYSEITYTLNPLDEGATVLTYERVKIPTAIEQQIFEAHLPSMLETIKQVAEENKR